MKNNDNQNANDMHHLQNSGTLLDEPIPYSANGLHSDKAIDQVTVKNYEQYGLRSAGQSDGAPDIFRRGLELVYRGKIVDESHNRNRLNEKKARIESEKAVLEERIQHVRADLCRIEDVLLPESLGREAEILTEMDEVKMGRAIDKTQSQFSLGKFIIYMVLTIGFAGYLVVFYSSALYMAFFNDVLTQLETAGTDTLSLLLTSIFSPGAFLNPGPAGWFTYAGVFFIFSLGILPHWFKESGMKGRYLWAFLAALLPLAIDFGIAIKIDEALQIASTAIGRETDPRFWTHINFWLVIAFGYLGYLAWGFMLQACFSEHRKRNPAHETTARMNGLKNKLKAAREATLQLRLRKSDHDSNIARHEEAISRLNKSLELVTYDVSDMIRNLESYVKGFYQYLVLAQESQKLESCRREYQNFKLEKFSPKVPPALN